MINSDVQFGGSIPGNYDRYMVPLIFAPYAQDLARRIEKLKPRKILETAAGTGVVSAAIAETLLPGASLVVTDLNPAMIAVAVKAISTPGVTFQQADATTLHFDEESFDVVVCQFGVMFFPDKLQGFKAAHRVLRKGGTFLFNVWDVIKLNDIASIVSDVLANLFPDDPPTFMARTPHGYNDIENIKATLTTAGFSNITAEVLRQRSVSHSARGPAIGYCQGTPMRGEIEQRDVTKLGLATDLAEKALVEKFGSGPIDASIQAIVFTATKA